MTHVWNTCDFFSPRSNTPKGPANYSTTGFECVKCENVQSRGSSLGRGNDAESFI